MNILDEITKKLIEAKRLIVFGGAQTSGKNMLGKNFQLERIRQAAVKNNWEEVDHQVTNRMVSFCRGNGKKDRINIYYTTMTVGTVITHPKKGRTQLFRRNVSFKEIEQLFENPRNHTNKGYYQL